MERTKSSYIPELLLLIGLAVSILLPRAIIPIGLIATGSGFLIYTALHSARSHALPKASFGPLTAAVFILACGIGLLVLPGQILVTFIAAVCVTIVIQMVWLAVSNKKPG